MNQTAQGLAALGRGPDTQLVHMAPSEVAGLQALAQRHGGSLTTNPDTGLPEAGFLSSILPMVLGAGAMMIPGLQGLGAGWIGAGIGGLTTLATGSLSKGLMAGLGAYGGAGLTQGLMGAATTAPAVGPALPTAVPEAALAAPTAAPTITATGAAPVTPGMQQLAGVPGKEVTSMLPQPAVAAAPVAAPVATVTPMAPSTSSGFGGAGTDLSVVAPPPPTTAMEKLASGAGNIPGSTGQFLSANKYPVGALGLSALMSTQPDELNAPEASKGMIRPYTYSREKIPGAFEDVAGAPMSSKERRYFTDKFTAGTPYKAPGAEYLAVGGPVEDMSNANAIGASTGYPQSGISTGAYSTPFQQPIGQNVVTGAQDAAIDPYTGQQRFADGGSVGGYTYDPRTGIYSKAGGAEATMVKPAGFGSAAGGQGGQGVAAPNSWANMTPAEQAAYYSANPTMAAITQAGLSGLGALGLDVAQQNAVAHGFAPSYYSDPGAAVSADQNAAADTGGIGGGDISGQSEGTPALARGGISNLGDYSDGGRLLRGPGDGVSDSIPAMIGQKQQARLADGEFVVPARIVSELGNGSTEAGARQLYAMMDRVQKNRKKSMGKDKVAADSKSSKLLPA